MYQLESIVLGFVCLALVYVDAGAASRPLGMIVVDAHRTRDEICPIRPLPYPTIYPFASSHSLYIYCFLEYWYLTQPRSFASISQPRPYTSTSSIVMPFYLVVRARPLHSGAFLSQLPSPPRIHFSISGYLTHVFGAVRFCLSCSSLLFFDMHSVGRFFRHPSHFCSPSLYLSLLTRN